jgi:phage baseplate assembly protein W
MVHEPLTTANRDFVAENVTEIINYDPRVQVDAVTVSQYLSGIQVECQLTYLTYNISENLRLKFDEDAGLLN